MFWDRHIPAGKTWRTYIGEALDTSRCVIVAWSHSSITSKWVTEEADVGQKRDALIPIFIDAVEIPIGFRSIQTANLSNWQPDQDSQDFDALINDIREVLKASGPTVQKPISPILDPRFITKTTVKTQSKNSKIRHAYKWMALILFVIVAGFWSYKNWYANSANTKPALSGLVFATKIEANGQALDPGTSFSQDITDLYAVFRADMVPPGMRVNVKEPVEGDYYSYMSVIDSTDVDRFGWSWYYNGEKVNNHEMDVEANKNYWLQYYDYNGAGVFGGKFSPGNYTIVILMDGNPAMSSELTIHPVVATEE